MIARTAGLAGKHATEVQLAQMFTDVLGEKSPTRPDCETLT